MRYRNNFLVMEFRKELTIKPFAQKLSINDKVLLVGSCFSDNLGEKLLKFKFDVRINPHGTLFNPISIAAAMQAWVDKRTYTETDIFFHQELWKSWEHHSQFSDLHKEGMIDRLNNINFQTHAFLKETKTVIVTLGSAWVYEKDGVVVANCHKVPANQFQKRLLSVTEIKDSLNKMIDSLKQMNPAIQIIFTISPVRHLRDGFIENNRSKAMLIQAVHELVEEKFEVHYFPAYELIIDDLRDYRYYDVDMVHPNYIATDYVWMKFQEACIDDYSLSFFEEINLVNAGMAHKPFQPDSQAHKQFREVNYKRVEKLKAALPHLDWKLELDFFKD